MVLPLVSILLLLVVLIVAWRVVVVLKRKLRVKMPWAFSNPVSSQVVAAEEGKNYDLVKRGLE